VRVNPLGTGLTLGDLAAVVRPGLAGIVLPKVEGPQDLRQVSHYLDALETREGLEPGSVQILPIASETGAAVFQLGSYADITPRLAGLTWGAEDLATAVGAAGNRVSGELTDLFRLARSLCLAGAAAASVPAIETVYADFRDTEGLRRYVERGAFDGFRGMMAIHPSQVEIINQGFTPAAEALERAQRIVDLFAANPGAGALQLNGQMVDAPHLKQARRLLRLD
jgi:citrate lyase subunit beta/citryl-CoA lyase